MLILAVHVMMVQIMEQHIRMRHTLTLTFSSKSTIHTYGCEFGNFWKYPVEKFRKKFRKFIPIFQKISGNLLITYVNQLY